MRLTNLPSPVKIRYVGKALTRYFADIVAPKPVSISYFTGTNFSFMISATTESENVSLSITLHHEHQSVYASMKISFFSFVAIDLTSSHDDVVSLKWINSLAA